MAVVFKTKSLRKNVPDVGIELVAASMLSGHASDQATVPGSDVTEQKCLRFSQVLFGNGTTYSKKKKKKKGVCHFVATQ